MSVGTLPWSRRLLGALMGRRRVATSGRVNVRGARGTLRIRRDDYGVPYIEADSEHDGWFGLGFCHAQDRAAQLELTLRAVRGTLAALVGPELLPIDRLSRRIGFRRAGDAQLALARPEVAEQIAAYVRGVNAGLQHGAPPHELALLRRPPSRWEPGDVQGYSLLLCFALASNWDVELMRLKVLLEDGPRALELIDAPYPESLPVSWPSGAAARGAAAAAGRLASEVEQFGRVVRRAGGSNAWVIGPSKSRSGRPLLANDPHLPNAIPAVMYLAQIRSPGLAVAGASWVGVPAFAPGHNGHVAWGATAAHADNTDLFLEQVSSDGLGVRDVDGWIRCPVREERIEVRGEAPVLERVLQTPRGPIISPALSDMALPDGANALSLAATWLAKRPYEGLYSAPRASSFDEFRQHFAAGSASTISYVYADTSGAIGWHLAVEVPRRRRPGALIPRVGWDPDAAWHDEPHRCTDLPFARDPDEGFLCTANNQPVSATNGVSDDLGVDWLDGYRQASIAEALGKRDDWDVQDCADLQRDTLSLPWRELEPTVLGLSLRDTRARRAQSLLAQWDGRVSSDSAAAAVYVLFVSELTCALVRCLAPRSSSWALGKGFTAMLPHSTIANRRMSHLVAMVKQQPVEVFPDWPAALEAALARAVAKLEDRFGGEPNAWRWGRVRPLTLVHAFADKPPFDRVFNVGPLEGEGDPSTISQGGLDLADPFSGQLWLPTLRAVMDVGDWERCRFALAGGQSGNPTSPHYADQIAVWRTGEGIPIAWSEEAIARRCRYELELVPH